MRGRDAACPRFKWTNHEVSGFFTAIIHQTELWIVNKTHSWHVCFWQKPSFSSSDLHCCSFLILQLFAVFVHGSQIFLTCRGLNVINSQCVRTVCACAHVRGPHCLPVPTVAPLIYHVWLLWVRYIKDKQENEGIYLECWAAYKYF